MRGGFHLYKSRFCAEHLLGVLLLSLAASCISLSSNAESLDAEQDLERTIARPVFFTPKKLYKIREIISQNVAKISEPNVDFDAAFCSVEDGKIVCIAKDFLDDSSSDKSAGKLISLPLGRTSVALLSLISLEMSAQKKIPHGALLSSIGSLRVPNLPEYPLPANEICSLVTPPISSATLADFFNMRAGIPPRFDSLIPYDTSPVELFSMVSGLKERYAPSLQFSKNDFSAISASVGAYVLAYAVSKKADSLSETLRESIFEKYLRRQLGLKALRYVSLTKYDRIPKSLEPAYSFALSIEDIAQWLECETSHSPKIADRENIVSRRILSSNPEIFSKNYSGGWLNAQVGKLDFLVASDAFRACANICAIFQKENCALSIVVFARKHKKDASNSDICRETLVASECCAKIFDSTLKILSE